MNFGKIILETQKLITLLNKNNNEDLSNFSHNNVFQLIQKIFGQINLLAIIQDGNFKNFLIKNYNSE